MIVRLIAIVAVIVGVGRAQDWPDRFEIKLLLVAGTPICDRASAVLELSPRYRSLLRPNVTDAQLNTAFCDAIDRYFKTAKKPYTFALTTEQAAQDAQGQRDAAVEKLRTTNSWQDLLRVELFLPSEYVNIGIAGIKEHSPFSEVFFPEDGRFDLRRFQFHLRDPLQLDKIQLGGFAPSLPALRFRQLLAPQDRLPTDPERVSGLIATHYPPDAPPKITLKLELEPPVIEVYERKRLERLQMPLEIDTCSRAERLVYETTPSNLYKAFRVQCDTWLKQALPEGAQKRELSLATLLGGGAMPAEARLPVFDEAEFQEQKSRLEAIGFELGSLLDEDRQVLDYVINQAKAPVTGSTAPDGKKPFVPASDLEIPAGKNNRIYGGVEYQPQQGVRPFAGYQRRNLGGPGIFAVEFGVQDELFASGSYTRDLGLWFGMLVRLTGEGNSDFRNQRILDGVLTDERRTGGGAHADVEILRNSGGHRLSANGGFQRETVRLQPADEMQTGAERVFNLTFVDLSLSHIWAKRLGVRAASVHWNPSLRVGLGASATERPYARFAGEAAYHQEVSGRTSLHFRVHGGKATESTPLFELLSLGGENSVRGFRSDDAIGQSYWSVQNEFWVRFLPKLGDHKLLVALERNLHLAPFFDVGQVIEATGDRSLPGVRRGAGAGIRFPFRGIVFALDWGYGWGDGAFGRGRGRIHFNFLVP